MWNRPADCWERDRNKEKNNKKKFQGKCNYCGIKQLKEVNIWKKTNDNNTNEDKVIIEDDI